MLGLVVASSALACLAPAETPSPAEPVRDALSAVVHPEDGRFYYTALESVPAQRPTKSSGRLPHADLELDATYEVWPSRQQLRVGLMRGDPEVQDRVAERLTKLSTRELRVVDYARSVVVGARSPKHCAWALSQLE